MRMLSSWPERSPEEASLFNPAFCGSLIYEFVKAYEKENPQGVPLPLLPVALAIALHPATRKRLPSTTITSLYEWVQRNADSVIGLSQRAENLLPNVKESLRFVLGYNAIKIANGFCIAISSQKASFTPKFLEDSTFEVREIVDKTRFLARWFVKSGSTSSVLSCFGVMP